MTRTTEDWGTSNSSADLDLWANLWALRGRARRLSTNNPLVRKYIRMCLKNIRGQGWHRAADEDPDEARQKAQ